MCLEAHVEMVNVVVPPVAMRCFPDEASGGPEMGSAALWIR